MCFFNLKIKKISSQAKSKKWLFKRLIPLVLFLDIIFREIEFSKRG